MDGLQWYPKYVGDYSRKTHQISMLEHGAYNLLLDHYYATGKPLLSSIASSNAELMPDHSRLYRICSAISKQEQEAVDFVLTTFFKWTKKGYVNKKADEVIEKQRLAHSRRVNAGRKGGLSKASSNAKAKLKQSDPEPEPNKILSFDIRKFLAPHGKQRARDNSSGWSMDILYEKYNEIVRSGKFEIPDQPNSAFPAWVLSFTKGKPPT